LKDLAVATDLPLCHLEKGPLLYQLFRRTRSRFLDEWIVWHAGIISTCAEMNWEVMDVTLRDRYAPFNVIDEVRPSISRVVITCAVSSSPQGKKINGVILAKAS
jgi:hypothetical protein